MSPPNKPRPPSPVTISHPTLFIPARSFNTVHQTRSTVTKTSSHPSILGELFFYKNIPSEITHLFPPLLHHKTSGQQTSLTIRRIRGHTLSALLVARPFSHLILVDLLDALRALHDTVVIPRRSAPLSIYENYARKVAGRHEHFKHMYRAHGVSAQHFSTLEALLRDFESEERGVETSVVHGDPVFTNVILEAGRIFFIDMRGALGEHVTLRGDAIYDLAKVFQSLCGYDFVLAGADMCEGRIEELARLREVFWERVGVMYPSVRCEDVLLVTCSLFTSLIPLHENVDHRRKFASIARGLLRLVCSDGGGDLNGVLRRVEEDVQ